VSGPAGKLMRAKGYEVSPKGVAEVYADFLDLLVVDHADRGVIRNSVATNTIMKSKEDAVRLAEFVVSLFDRI